MLFSFIKFNEKYSWEKEHSKSLSRGVTVCVFVPNPHGTDVTVQCIQLYEKYIVLTGHPVCTVSDFANLHSPEVEN